MKKLPCFILSTCLMVSIITGCGETSSVSDNKSIDSSVVNNIETPDSAEKDSLHEPESAEAKEDLGTTVINEVSEDTNTRIEQSAVVVEPEQLPPASVVQVVSQNSTNSDITFILNTNSKKVHIPSYCDGPNQMLDKNKLEISLNRAEMEREYFGTYSICGNCKKSWNKKHPNEPY